MTYEVRGGPQDHRVRIKFTQSTGLMEPPCQHDRECALIKLNSFPIRLAVDPEVLMKTAVGLLGAGKIDERSARRIRVSRRQQTCRAVHHVARPYEVIAAAILIAT